MNLTTDLPKAKQLSNGNLLQCILSIVQFSTREVLVEGNDPDYQKTCVWHAAYIVSCFIAQHTKNGQDGVDTEYVERALKLHTLMPDLDRLVLIGDFLKEFQ